MMTTTEQKDSGAITRNNLMFMRRFREWLAKPTIERLQAKIVQEQRRVDIAVRSMSQMEHQMRSVASECHEVLSQTKQVASQIPVQVVDGRREYVVIAEAPATVEALPDHTQRFDAPITLNRLAFHQERIRYDLLVYVGQEKGREWPSWMNGAMLTVLAAARFGEFFDKHHALNEDRQRLSA